MFNGLRPFRLALLALGLVSLASCRICRAQNPAPAQSTAQDTTFRIAGTIVNALDGSPLGRARVSVSETTNRPNPVSMVTSETGRFEFAGLKAAKFSLQGAKRGFISAAYDQHEQFSTAIVTGAGFDSEHLVLRLTPMASLAGKVVDESGDPVRHARVALYREDHSAGLNRITAAGNSSTDDLGSYEFPYLAPGNYFVSAQAKPWYAIHPASSSPDGTPNRASVLPSLDVSYPTTYYDGATEGDLAVPIPLKPGDRLQIDVRLNPVPSLHIIFHVPEGQQSFGQPIFVKRVFDGERYVQSDGMRPIGPGVYELAGIPAGKYTVRRNDPKNGQVMQSAEMELSKDGQELEDSPVEPAGKAKLSVQLSHGEQPPKQLFVALQDSRRRIVAYQQLGDEGIVVLENLPAGRYTVLVSSPNKAYSVARAVSKGTESLGHELNISPGASIELTLFLAEGATNVEGFAKRGEKAAAGVMVILVPKDPESHQELFRRDQSDLDGSFALRGVIPGKYTIVAVEDAWGFPWQQPDVLARYIKHGQSVAIPEMMQGSVHLTDPVAVQPR